MADIAASVALPLAEHDVQLPLRGRQAIAEELTNLIGRGDATVRTRVLHGLGGSGKTLLALHVAREIAANGTPVWWVPAAEPSQFVTAMHAVAQLLGATEEMLQDRDPADILWLLLEARTEPWLLVIDNADVVSVLDSESDGDDGRRTVAGGRAWLRPLASGPGMVIVTSRDGDPRRWGRWCALTPIGKLENSDGAQVLLDHTRDRCGSRDEAEKLAARLGGLPLALSLAGSYLADNIIDPWPDADTPTTFAAYLAALNAGRRDLLTSHPADDDEGRNRQLIGGIWRLSMDLLEQRGITGARSLMRLLSHFAQAPVPYRLMLKPEVLQSSSIFAGIGRDKLRSILIGAGHLDLIDLSSLATPADAAVGEIPLLSLHPLMRDASLHQEDPEHSGGDYLNLAAHLLCAATQGEEPFSSQDPKRWPLWQLLSPHALLLLKGLADQQHVDVDLVKNVALVTDLTIRQAHVRGLYRLAYIQYRALQEACTKALGADHPSVLSSRHGAALALKAQGDFLAAQTEIQEVIASRRQLLGEEHPDTLTSRHNLGTLLMARDNYTAAQTEFNAVLDSGREVFGEEHPNTLNTRHNLARILQLRGEHEAARMELNNLLAIRRRVFGEEHPETLTTRRHLASTLRAHGEHKAAQTELNAILAVERRVLGEEHPNTLGTRHNLASILHSQGEHKAAQTEFEKVLAIRRRVLGPQHPNTLGTRHSLARVLQARGEYTAALAEYEAVANLMGRVFGPRHRRTLAARKNFEQARRAAASQGQPVLWHGPGKRRKGKKKK